MNFKEIRYYNFLIIIVIFWSIFGCEDVDVVELEIDGRLQRSGSHYTVDYDNNKIVTESGLNAGSWVRVKIYNK